MRAEHCAEWPVDVGDLVVADREAALLSKAACFATRFGEASRDEGISDSEGVVQFCLRDLSGWEQRIVGRDGVGAGEQG